MKYLNSLPEEEEEEEEEENYEDQYPIENANNDNLETIDTAINYINEETPDGSIFIKYDKDAEAFDYWSDNVISYKYLEAAARKYVTIYCCRDFYIDREEDIKKQVDNEIKYIEGIDYKPN